MKLDRAGIPFVVLVTLLTVVVGWLAGPLYAVPLLALAFFVAWFFRDPHRVSPNDPQSIVSPADGKIIVASSRQISIFMNVFNVHVCRTPVAGKVEDVRHVTGSFLAAYRDEASEHNERATISVHSMWGDLHFALVAGLVARRIVCRVRPGDELEKGQRVGLIRFGSRVDVLLPPGCDPRVGLGQRVVAGETVLARFVE